MENKKLKLDYIIIGALPENQRDYLKMNLRQDRVRNEDAQIIWLEKATVQCTQEDVLCQYPPERCFFIAEDKKQLKMAKSLGLATLGYLCPKSERARAHGVETVDKRVDNSAKMCTNLNVHGEAQQSESECDDVNPDMWAEGFEEIGLEFLTHVYERHHGLPWTILETERCIIKEFSMDYLDDLFELYSGEGMTDYMEPLYPYEEEKAYQEAYIKHMYGFYGYGMWIVCEKATGKLIGRAGLEHREELEGEMELGYAIGVPYQRKGYATEVCKAILDYAKSELLQESVCCLIEEGNEVSEYFAEKLGFFLKDVLVLDGKRMKKYVYMC